MFTLTDKVLVDRAARLINGIAKDLRLAYEAQGWAVTKESRAAKLEYDRLLRDERDLRVLGKRLAEHFKVAPAPRVKVASRQAPEGVKTTGSAIVADAPPDLLAPTFTSSEVEGVDVTTLPHGFAHG